MSLRSRYLAWWWRTACHNVLAADRARKQAAGELVSVADRVRATAALERLAEAGEALERVEQVEEMLTQCEALWVELAHRLASTEAIDLPRLVVPAKWQERKH